MSAPVDVLAVRSTAPGPWFIEYEPGWPITVSRWNPANGYDYESMTDERGNLREFHSHGDARAAIRAASEEAVHV